MGLIWVPEARTPTQPKFHVGFKKFMPRHHLNKTNPNVTFGCVGPYVFGFSRTQVAPQCLRDHYQQLTFFSLKFIAGNSRSYLKMLMRIIRKVTNSITLWL